MPLHGPPWLRAWGVGALDCGVDWSGFQHGLISRSTPVRIRPPQLAVFLPFRPVIPQRVRGFASSSDCGNVASSPSSSPRRRRPRLPSRSPRTMPFHTRRQIPSPPTPWRPHDQRLGTTGERRRRGWRCRSCRSFQPQRGCARHFTGKLAEDRPTARHRHGGLVASGKRLWAETSHACPGGADPPSKSAKLDRPVSLSAQPRRLEAAAAADGIKLAYLRPDTSATEIASRMHPC